MDSSNAQLSLQTDTTSMSEAQTHSFSASSSSYFTTFATFIETVMFDSNFAEQRTYADYFEEDNTLYYLQVSEGAPPAGQAVVAGIVVKPDPATLPSQGCYSQGYFPLLGLGTYLECIPVPGAGFRPLYRSCPNGYVFDVVAGACVHASAKNVLRHDLGFRLGPGPGISATVPGENPFLDFSQFPGISPICSGIGAQAFGNEDRFFLSCIRAGAPGNV